MNLKQGRQQWAKRRRAYVVGYLASGNVLYHHERWDKGKRVPLPMTLKEAQQRLDTMPSPGCAIFRLEPIAIGGGKRD